MTIPRILAVVAAGALAGPVAIYATPITYTWMATGDGSFGSTAFSDAPFTLSASSDTELVAVRPPGLFRAPASIATVTVAGLGSATLTNSIAAVLNSNTAGVGVSDFTLGRAILFVTDDAFSTYDLASNIGPVSGPSTFNAGLVFPTTGGGFSLTSVSTAIFQAVVRDAPEPGTLALLGLGLAGLGLSRRRLAA